MNQISKTNNKLLGLFAATTGLLAVVSMLAITPLQGQQAYATSVSSGDSCVSYTEDDGNTYETCTDDKDTYKDLKKGICKSDNVIECNADKDITKGGDKTTKDNKDD